MKVQAKLKNGNLIESKLDNCEMLLLNNNNYYTELNGELVSIITPLDQKIIMGDFLFIKGKKLIPEEMEQSNVVSNGIGYRIDDMMYFINLKNIAYFEIETINMSSKLYRIHVKQYVKTIMRLIPYNFLINTDSVSPQMINYFA